MKKKVSRQVWRNVMRMLRMALPGLASQFSDGPVDGTAKEITTAMLERAAKGRSLEVYIDGELAFGLEVDPAA